MTRAPLSREEIEARVGDFDWYHTIDLARGIRTRGQYDHAPLLDHYGIPADLSGRTALDVGPAHGFFAFELEARGARVMTIELPAWHDHDAGAALRQELADPDVDRRFERYLHDTLAFAIDARGSRVERRFKSIYDLDEAEDGRFDLVLCASVLLHVSDPLRALAGLRRVTREMAIVCTAADPDAGDGQPRALFWGSPNGQTFWVPNLPCFERLALTAGFARVEHVSTFFLTSVDGRFNTPHTTIRAFVQ